jgi:hypothetical protein
MIDHKIHRSQRPTTNILIKVDVKDSKIWGPK